jgi:TolB-like protein/tetratricopeptide (TPR) repeat protein
VALSPGTRLGPYEVLSPLGAGGMGEVYRARDTRLGRDVALKILPEERSSDPERLRRFETEARAVASLNHPHILALYDVGTHDGVPYAVMELLEGRTLRTALARGPLPPRKVVDYGVQICRGLAAAHERGIIHRDLKPENLFVTRDGQIKILDFGLAKLTGPVEGGDTAHSQIPTATEPRLVMGTAGYMSPEQARGRPADARSDLFSLGAILYEMLSGRRAFSRDTSADTLSAILNEDPPEIQPGSGSVPPGLERVVRRCLEKSPQERTQTVRELAFALEALSTAGGALPRSRRGLWAGAAALAVLAAVTAGSLWLRPRVEPPSGVSETRAERKRLVVLPFENLGPPEDAYFAAGMTEEITSRLAQVSGLGVISRTSAVQYDRTGKTAKQIGEDLGVGFVLEGTVRWDRGGEGPGRVRITPQLIRVADDTHLWTDRYDRVLDDVFASQSEIAEAVVEQLGVTLLPQEKASLEARPTENMEAYQAYLRGMEHLGNPWEHTRESQDLAVQVFERATEQDPDFVEAHAALADAHLSIYARYEPTPERLAQARRALDRALALDPESPDAHLALGMYYEVGETDPDRALEEYTLVARRRPNNSRAAELIARNLLRRGRFDDAVAEFERTLDLDPRNALIARILGIAHTFLGQYRQAEGALDRAIALAPGNPRVYEAKVDLYLKGGRLDRARAALEAMPGSRQAWARWVTLETWERNYQAALDHLAAVRTEAIPVIELIAQKEVSEGDLYRLMNRPQRARASYETAVDLMEKTLRERAGRFRPGWPDELQPRVLLAQAYAGLGRKTEAIREASRAVELASTSRNKTLGGLVRSMPAVYATVGEHEVALDLLETLATSVPSWVSYGQLRFDPGLDPLRESPRFQKLLADKKAQLPPP